MRQQLKYKLGLKETKLERGIKLINKKGDKYKKWYDYLILKNVNLTIFKFNNLSSKYKWIKFLKNKI